MCLVRDRTVYALLTNGLHGKIVGITSLTMMNGFGDRILFSDHTLYWTPAGAWGHVLIIVRPANMV